MKHTRSKHFGICAFLSLSLVSLLGLSLAQQVVAAELSGTVRNILTFAPAEGVAVVLDPAVAGVDMVTGVDGTYSSLPGDIPDGMYTVTFQDDRFVEQSETIQIGPSATVQDADLTPIANVIVTTEIVGDALPDGSVMANATWEIMDGSTFQSILWTQQQSVPVVISDETTPNATVDLPDVLTYRDELIVVLESPPISEDQLPPNVVIPPGGFVGGLQDRFQVVGINPFALENAGHVGLEAAVTTDSGTYVGGADIHTTLPWKTAPGIENVPLGRAVLLHGKTDPLAGSYDWMLSSPGGSSSTLTDSTNQSPWFVPDTSGKYTVTVTDPTQAPGSDPITIEIYAGTWSGVITGQDNDGLPLAGDCTGCHNPGGVPAPDNFTPWSQTGHAAIFSDLLDTTSYYNESCFACHTVGHDLEVDNGGIDDQADYGDFMAFFSTRPVPGDNWTTMLGSYSDSARLGNVQCENCHGPQNSSAHRSHDPRMSLSSETCATCHGEPLRHARFQQWQLSLHSNYELAEARSTSGDCSRCHTANGFLTWLPVLNEDEPGDPLASVVVTWTPDESHPQTCATCHDPHSTGTTSGLGTDATVRISGDTPPLIAGFTATDVSHGAMCMTCHNTRRGLRNDSTWDQTLAAGDEIRAPHAGSQADVLMGQNAYFVEVGNRGKHSITTDADPDKNVEHTCVTCHMEKTPPPDDLAYNLTGTNHTFFASPEACVDCHGFTGDVIQGPNAAKIDLLQEKQEEALLGLITDLMDAGNKIDMDGEVVILDAADIEDLVFGESSGRQAITVTVNSVAYGPTRVDRVNVLDSGGVGQGHLYDFAWEGIPKAGWNWGLVHNDGSSGAHNNAYVNTVLDASMDALAAPEPGSASLALAATGALGWLARRRRGRGGDRRL